MANYFFQIEEESYFIKFSESNVSIEEISKYYEKEIEIKEEIVDGLRDTDEPNVQSRVSKYIIIYKIIEKE